MEYETIARLGRGGMGTVDLARDTQGNKVAMKRLTLHGSANEMIQARQRLLREAHILRRLNHSNIVRLLDVVEDGDEIILVMPYLPGGNLAERVNQHGPAPAPEVERLAQSLLGALAAAHAAGVIHRDLKPGNVLYDSQGEPMLADFGLAFTWDQTAGLTATGMVVGTPGFIAPEQARGEPLTPASDVFSLGATLRFAATGSGPFGMGDPTLLMVRAADARIEKLPRGLPAPLRQKLMLMLEPRPDRRPSAAELLNGAVRPRRTSTRAMVGGTAAALFAAGVLVLAAQDGGSGEGSADETSLTPDGPAPTEPGADSADTDSTEAPEDDGANPVPGGDSEDGEPLLDQMRGTLSPRDESDTFPLPANPADACPQVVTLTLSYSQGAYLDLIVVDQNDEIVAMPSEEDPDRLEFEYDCDNQYWAVVTAIEIGGEAEYTIERRDG